MFIYALDERLEFPPPLLMSGEDPIALGGDLSPERLMLAYSKGIFPWYSEDQPILWWSPDPRLILIPSEIRISRSLGQRIRNSGIAVTMDKDFGSVIRGAARAHTDVDGSTWITAEMIEAYERLHELGHAHSIESWRAGELVGGLYGVSIGGFFSGESMFALERDASKIALVHLTNRLFEWGYPMIDCQVRTGHLMSLGAREVSRGEYLEMLGEAILLPGRPGRWQ